MGVITAPETRYAVRIHEDILYDVLKSLIRSGIAGINIALDPSKLRTPCNGDFFTQDSGGGLADAG